MFKRKGLVLGVLIALSTAATPLYAQSTAAGLSGRVVDNSGRPVAGATVEIVHLPSGTRRTVTTDAEGRYDARGLRVGGPYRVTSTADGFTSDTEENVFLRLDESTNLLLEMSSAATALEAVEVVAAAMDMVFTPDNMGARTNITRQDIDLMPTINRSFQDIVRLDPRITIVDKGRNEISAAGQNNRYNNIKVDGVPTNDQFGLNPSGLPSLNNPISIDWIQEFNVGISTYDVTQTDFVGATINAVTRSGGNEFKGAVYGIYRDNDMISDEPSKFRGFDREWTAGAYVGGPIIEDTLFFFLGYEKFERASPAPDIGLPGSGAGVIVNLTQADLDRIIATARARGMNPGEAALAGPDNTDEKWIAKLDWNINDFHRLTYRYTKTEGTRLDLGTQSQNALTLSSGYYRDNISFESNALILYSSWTDSFSSEANVSYARYRSLPTTPVREPSVTVTVGNTAVTFGTERSRHANQLEVDTWTALFAGDVFLGDHTVRFGFDYEKNDVFNLFLQDVFGTYNFGSIAAWEAATPSWTRYRLQRPINGDINSVAADFGIGTVGFFLQDTWSVNPNLNVLFGTRVDRAIVDERPAFNAAALTAFGFDNSVTNDGEVTVQPRLGFNYTFDTERSTQLRGGVGLFFGSAPGVWVSNAFSNPGTRARSFDLSNGTGFTADPSNPILPGGTPLSVSVDFLAPNFQQPTVWRSNLAFEHELPWMGLIAGAEWVRTITEKGVAFSNLNLGPARFTLPDGRNAFWTTLNPANFTATGTTGGNQARAGRNTAFNNVILLRNTDKGHADNLTLSISKPMRDDNWSARFAYTYGESAEVSPAPSSVALSNWQNHAIFNANEDVLARANYEIKHRFTGLFSYRLNLIDGYPTTASLFYEGRSGRPFSYTFIGDANGDGISGNDLFFIPRPGQVQFSSNSSAQDIAAFQRYIEEVRYLRENQGRVAGRNAVRSPSVNQFDLRISQELPGFFDDNRAELFVNIENVGNLINKDWGKIEQYPFPLTAQLARFRGVDPATGRYVYDVSNYFNETTGAFNFPAPTLQDGSAQSRWAVQVGFRYEF